VRSVVCFFLVVLSSVLAASEPVPLLHAHAHNDYEHARPLFDALERGFCSIEADVYLVGGQLLVAHDRKDVKPERTLAKLYLDPLRERVRRNGGRVFRDGPTIVLLVDVKSEAGSTYAALHSEFAKHAEMLTTFRTAGAVEGAVTVIISGNRAPQDMLTQSIRYAAMDGRKEDLESNSSSSLVPLVSENWKKIFTWNWEGEMPAGQRTALAEWVSRAHTQGRKVRFWNTPDREDAWRILVEAGVDVLGTDDLDGLSRFLRSRTESGSRDRPKIPR
jgi:glycerophosphoryl diester phosphodiesterase